MTMNLDAGLITPIISLLRTNELRQAFIRSSGSSGARGYFDACDSCVSSSNATNCLPESQHLPPSIVVFYRLIIATIDSAEKIDGGGAQSSSSSPLFVFPGIPTTTNTSAHTSVAFSGSGGDGSGATTASHTGMLIDLGLIQHITSTLDCNAMNTALGMVDGLGLSMTWFGTSPFLNLTQTVVSSLNFINGSFVERMYDEHPFTSLAFKSINFFPSLAPISSLLDLQQQQKQKHHFSLGNDTTSGTVKKGWRLTTLAQQCFAECTHLESCSLEALSNVDAIESNFFLNCSSLRFLDLTPFRCVTEMGGNFLKGCSSLVEIDVSSLSQVTAIDDGFLEGCSGLKRIAGTDSWRSLGSFIGHRFLMGCSSLKWCHPSKSAESADQERRGCDSQPFSLRFIEINNVHFISTDFLAGCTGLEYVSLKSFGTLEGIDCGFLSKCTSLKHIDASAINGGNVVVGDLGFLHGCNCVVGFDLPSTGGVDGGPMGRLLTAHTSKLSKPLLH